MNEIVQVKKMFSKKSMDELPLLIVSNTYKDIMNIYNTQIAGLMGVYLLGRMHGEKDKK
jgi:hypothetical protein